MSRPNQMDWENQQDAGLGKRPGGLDDEYLRRKTSEEVVTSTLASAFRAGALDPKTTTDT